MVKRRSSSLVRYANKRARYSYSPRVRAAVAIGKYAWRNRARIAGAYGRLRKVSNWVTRSARRHIGEKVGTTSAQRIEQANNGLNLATRTLYFSALTSIPEGGTGSTDRRKDTVNLRGFLIQLNISNKVTNPVCYNWALVAPKDRNNGITTTNFFRSYGAQRGETFSATTLSSIDFKHRPINTDLYHILAHKRIMLAKNAGETDGNRGFYVNKKWYIPLKKQIRFEIQGDELSLDNIYWIVWCDINNSIVGTGVTDDVIANIANLVTYFRNTKN